MKKTYFSGLLIAAALTFLFMGSMEQAHAQSCSTATVGTDGSSSIQCTLEDGGTYTSVISAPTTNTDGSIFFSQQGTFTGTTVGTTDINYTISADGLTINYAGTINVNGTTTTINCTSSNGVLSGDCTGLALATDPSQAGTALSDLGVTTDGGQTPGTDIPTGGTDPVIQTVIEELAEAIEVSREAVQRDQTRAVRQILTSRFRAISGRLVRARMTADNAQADYADKLASRMNTGISAGDADNPISLWTDASISSLDVDFSGAQSDGTSQSILFGADRAINGDLIGGGFIGYQGSDLDLDYAAGDQETDGVIIGGYLAYVLNDRTTLDASLAYTRLSNDINLIAGGSRGLGDFDADRFSGGINLNHFYGYEKWLFTGFAGINYSHEKTDSYTLSNGVSFGDDTSTLGMISTGGEAAYVGFENGFEPYAVATLEYETTNPGPADRTGAILGLGFRWQANDRLNVGLVGTMEQLRSKEDTKTIAANLRYSF